MIFQRPGRSASIVVPHYNDAEQALVCLSTLRTHLPGAYVILSDAGSDREQQELLRQYPGLYDQYLTEEYRLWPGEARNRGWLASQRPYTVFVDCDVEFLSGAWLDRHREVLEYYPHVGCVGGWGEAWFYGPSLQAYSLWDLEGWPPRTRMAWNANAAPAGFCHMVNSGLVTVRTDLRDRLRWDAKHPLAEDLRFCCELLNLPLHPYFLPAEVIHRMGDKPGHWGGQEMQESVAALLRDHRGRGRQRRSAADVRHYLVEGAWPSLG